MSSCSRPRTNIFIDSLPLCRQLLGTPSPDQTDGTLTWRRRRAEQLRSPIARQSEEQFTDGDDEILESLVKTATKASGTRTTPRERKRTRHADRKSCKLHKRMIALIEIDFNLLEYTTHSALCLGTPTHTRTCTNTHTSAKSRLQQQFQKMK